ncbi:MAG: site-specific DNA-methyltransferase [Anaerolineae bacterium]
MPRKKPTGAAAPTPVTAIKHRDTRVNIPTEELRDFVADDERAPQTMRYPRDPSLDPQLVWKGKDEQDAADLAVDNVPVYIQEKVHPQALIEDLRAYARAEADAGQPALFADFNGLTFEDAIDFYHHEQHWANRLILGDSLLVMTSLAEREALKGKVQMIYLDPPYGIKFGSNWQVSTRKRDVKDGKVEDLTRQPEQIKAFRDTWEMGIHSYLSYLRDRLTAARELLTESGSIFVQIGEENVHLVRCLMDEIFGSENSVALISFRKKTMPLGAIFLERMDDYLVWYAKDVAQARDKYRQLYRRQDVSGDFHWNWYELPDGSRRRISEAQLQRGEQIPSGAKVCRLVSMWPPSFSASAVFPVMFRGKDYVPAEDQCWPTNPDGMQRLVWADRLEIEGRNLRYVLRLDDYDLVKLTTSWQDTIGARDQRYVVETSTNIVERCLLMTTDPGDLVLDPTCGSGTTAYVAEQWGRRWITIDTSRVALALARTRLMAARFPYYLLADSPEGVKKEAELTGQFPEIVSTGGDIRKGFVYRRVPHVTLKSIANNPDIRAGMSRQEIDAAIARHAETELLYDQPYEDNKRVRVSGPFTAESLSPHRVLAADEERPASEADGRRDAAGEYVPMIVGNLRKAGVQNTKAGERLKFDRLEPYAGTWLHAAGEYTDRDGKSRRVAVHVGPEHSAVGPEAIKEAAKEAVQGLGFDLLLVCGLAFDPHVSEEVRRYGRLTVQTVRINADLTMGDEVLKKTGAGNLFMIFGEPDITLAPQADGRLVATLRGLDIYDPTTGEIRSASTDDIACWFIDTAYNGESFFVRHAYFTGADRPYERLQRTLRADIDETAWSTLYSTESRPFGRPPTGKIAVKVINHYGDEVLKVFNV